MKREDFPVEIGGTRYLLRFKFSAARYAQSVTDKPFLQLFAAMIQGDMEAVRVIFHAALRTHHADVTLDQVDAILDEAEIAATMRTLAECVNAGFTFSTAKTDDSKKNEPAGLTNPAG